MFLKSIWFHLIPINLFVKMENMGYNGTETPTLWWCQEF